MRSADPIARYSHQDYLIGNTNRGILQKIFNRLNRGPNTSVSGSNLPEVDHNQVSGHEQRVRCGLELGELDASDEIPGIELNGSEIHELDESSSIGSSPATDQALLSQMHSRLQSPFPSPSGEPYPVALRDYLEEYFPSIEDESQLYELEDTSGRHYH